MSLYSPAERFGWLEVREKTCDAFAVFWAKRAPLGLFSFRFFFLPVPLPGDALHPEQVSLGACGLLAHVSDLKAVSKCSRVLQIGSFAIRKLHPDPHGEDLQ